MSEQAHLRQRKPRNSHHPKNNNNTTSSDPTTSLKKPTIISDILTSTNKKKHNFSSATFRGLGCTASPQISVPSLIRTSANWGEPTNNISNNNTVVVTSSNNNNNKLTKKRRNHKTKKNINTVVNYISYSSDRKNGSFPSGNNNNGYGGGGGTSQSSLSLAALSSSCVGASDSVWCGPGIGLTTDAASVDCVVVSAPRHGRVKLDGVEKMGTLGHRERSCNPIRRLVTPEEEHFLESEAAPLVMPRYVSGSRFHRRVGNNYRDGLAEILMFQGDLRIGERSNRLDIYRDMRLDVDNMSYEELLELGDRIGYVSTGLEEDEINCCLRRTKLASFNDPSSSSSHMASSEAERKCSICQEEYESDDDDEMGKLHCGHLFHIDCIKHWLARKNMCPICKTEAV